MRARFATQLHAFYGAAAAGLTRAQVWRFYVEREELDHPDLVVALTANEAAYIRGDRVETKKPVETWAKDSESTVNTGGD